MRFIHMRCHVLTLRFDANEVTRRVECTLGVDGVAIAQTGKALLPARVPDFDRHKALSCIECEENNINTKRWDGLPLELASLVPLEKRCFADTAVTNHNKLDVECFS
jgi:hypothetical protein